MKALTIFYLLFIMIISTSVRADLLDRTKTYRYICVSKNNSEIVHTLVIKWNESKLEISKATWGSPDGTNAIVFPYYVGRANSYIPVQTVGDKPSESEAKLGVAGRFYKLESRDNFPMINTSSGHTVYLQSDFIRADRFKYAQIDVSDDDLYTPAWVTPTPNLGDQGNCLRIVFPK